MSNTKRLAERITGGKFKTSGMFGGYCSQDISHQKTIEISDGAEWWAYVRGRDLDNAKANAELIAEAFNITNETRLSPKELRAQRDEIIGRLERAWNVNTSEAILKEVALILKKVKP